MIYLDENLHNYKYLVEANDNYLVLSTSSRISGSSGDLDSVPCIYHYFQPSFVDIKSFYYSYDSFTFTDISDNFSTSIYDRADFPLIFICGFLIALICCFVLNQLTKLVYKGGIFGSN